MGLEKAQLDRRPPGFPVMALAGRCVLFALALDGEDAAMHPQSEGLAFLPGQESESISPPPGLSGRSDVWKPGLRFFLFAPARLVRAERCLETSVKAPKLSFFLLFRLLVVKHRSA